MDRDYIIVDWANNLMNFGDFETFDDAEDFLSEFLDEEYEDYRGEYYIILKKLDDRRISYTPTKLMFIK